MTSHCHCLLASIALLVAGPVGAGDIVATATADRESARLSDSVRVTLSVEGDAPLRVTVPTEIVAEASAAGWRVRPLGPATMTSRLGGKEQWVQVYRADPYLPGTPSQLSFAAGTAFAGTDPRAQTVTWPVIAVTVTSGVIGGSPADARPPTGIEELPEPSRPPSRWREEWALGGAGAVGLAGLVWHARRRRRTTFLPPAVEAERAIAGAAEISAIACADQISGAVRRYLERVVGLPALRLTTAELLAIDWPPAIRTELALVTERCDAVKFAGSADPFADRNEIFAAARRIVAGVLQSAPMPTLRIDQAAVFRQLRYRLVRNSLRVAVASGKVKLLTMLGTSGAVAAFVFALSWFAFDELFRYKVPVKGVIVGGLFDLMFFTLGVMLIFSTGIILYASLFTAPEARYLLTTPARADRVFATKFQAAIAFSSWAFLVLGLPILIAYGVVAGVPWYFYPLLPAYLLGFVLMPGSLSALIALLLVRFLPRNRKQSFVALGLGIALVIGVWVARVGLAARETLITQKKNELEGLLGQFQLMQHPLNPSHWLTTGLQAAARDEPVDALIPLAMIWSNGLVLYVLSAWVSKRVYRTAYDRVAGGGHAKRVYRSNVLDLIMAKLVWYLSPPTRVLVVKDFRTFRRDPTQWVVLFIFGGLLLLAASNFRQYYTSDLAVLDKYVVSLVNVAATCILMCAGLSRFIFPLISLEGRKFWILGLMPIKREQILMGKFAFAATGSFLVAEGLTLMSDILLGLPVAAIGVHALTVGVAAIGLSGMNVGLGAYMPNFRETDPSKIVVGFGGTVNMVLGLMFLVLVVGTMAAPVHAAGLAASLAAGRDASLPAWAFAGVPIGLGIGVVAVWVPLRLGARALRATEF